MKKLLILFLIVFSSFLLAQKTEAPEEKNMEGEKIEQILTDIDINAPSNYYYDPKGRRDPFKSLLIGRREETTEECTEGVICIYWDDIQLNGIWKVKGSYVAQILSKQNDLYLLKEEDLLADGQITKIDLNCVYYRQKVNDPTKINPYEDVEKCLETSSTK